MPAESPHVARQRDFRSRHRARKHAEAHDGDASPARRGKIPRHRLIPAGEPTLIDTPGDLSDLLGRLRAAGTFAYDTEFIGESSYHPVLCLIQVATAEEVALIDPLAGLDLTDFWKLMTDGSVRKLVHAGEQDLEPVVRHTGLAPANVFDTQLAAGFAAMSWPTALSKLAGEVAGVRLAKGFTFTDWSERPLSPRQLDYAADDVRYLPRIAAALDDRLADLGHAAWAAAACAEQCAIEKHLFSLDDALGRVKGGGGLDAAQTPILRELVAWRDAGARAADLPPRAFVKDEALVAIARKRKLEASMLRDVKFFPRPVAEAQGEAVVEAWARGRAAGGSAAAAAAPPPEPTPSQKFAASGLHAIFAALCHGRGLDPDLVASRNNVIRMAVRQQIGEEIAGDPIFHGWRREAVGVELRRVLAGGSAQVAWRGA